MATLYVNEQGSVVGVDGGYYVVKQKNDLLRKIPKETLEAITLFGNVHMTEPCVQECLRRGIAVNYFSANGAYFGRLTSTRHIKAERLRMQVHFSENEELCLQFAKKIVAAKIHNQMVVCRRYQRKQEAEDCLKQMKLAENKIDQCQNREEVMGYEGIAAREYFKALARLVQPAFRFNGRTRMPPKDAFNSMLSLGYTMLLYEIYGEVENRGLTPYIGVLHKNQEGHPALASDLMEEYGYRVQKSAFEALLDQKMFVKLRSEIPKVIDEKEDCVKIYRLKGVSETVTWGNMQEVSDDEMIFI